MTPKEFSDQLKISKERGLLTKECISYLNDMITEEYKKVFPLDKKIDDSSVNFVFRDINKLWPGINLEKIPNPVSYFKTMIKISLVESKRNKLY